MIPDMAINAHEKPWSKIKFTTYRKKNDKKKEI